MSPYFQIARLDHAFKSIFVVPGILAAMYFTGMEHFHLIKIIFGFISLTAASSANYTINEWLDREFDRIHPTKMNRPAARGLVTKTGVTVQYILLVLSSIIISNLVGVYFSVYIYIFLLAGVAYNVPPIRTKDIPHFDVIWESLNNPLRFLLGWFMVVVTWQTPPSSIILAYWAGGAYLMTVKRISDIATVDDKKLLYRYRPSLAKASITSLEIQANLAALLSVIFLTVFVVKYRIEMLLPMFGVALLFATYEPLLSGPNGLAQTPEYLYKSKVLNLILGLLIILFFLALFVDMPILSELLVPSEFINETDR